MQGLGFFIQHRLKVQVILIIGAAQALFFSLLLINKKKGRLHDRILATWLAILALHLAFAYWLFLKRLTYLNYVGYDAGIIVLYYSLMYVYARSVISGYEQIRRKWALHLLPCLVVYAVSIPFIRLDEMEKSSVLTENLSPLILLSLVLAIAFSVAYLVAVFRLINKHDIDIKRAFSFDDTINLLWLKKLAMVLTGIWLFFLLAVGYVYYLKFTSTGGSIQLYSNLDLIGYCLFTLFIYLLGFFGYRQGNIFSHQVPGAGEKTVGSENQPTPPKAVMVQQNPENENRDVQFMRRLDEYMSSEKPYLNNTLSLYELARQLNVSSHYLSHILNNRLHKNFYEFVNHHRIDEVKRRIASDHHAKYTILAIALDCGFNSKATFNRTFKNYTGYTPSQFQHDFIRND